MWFFSSHSLFLRQRYAYEHFCRLHGSMLVGHFTRLRIVISYSPHYTVTKQDVASCLLLSCNIIRIPMQPIYWIYGSPMRVMSATILMRIKNFEFVYRNAMQCISESYRSGNDNEREKTKHKTQNKKKHTTHIQIRYKTKCKADKSANNCTEYMRTRKYPNA